MHKIPEIIGDNGDFCQVMQVIVQEQGNSRRFYTKEGQLIGCVRDTTLEFATALAECYNALEGDPTKAPRKAEYPHTELCKCGKRMILVDNGVQPLSEGIIWRHWWCGCGHNEAAEPMKIPTKKERLRADWEEVNKEKP